MDRTCSIYIQVRNSYILKGKSERKAYFGNPKLKWAIILK
jgi:hypothetical protein